MTQLPFPFHITAIPAYIFSLFTSTSQVGSHAARNTRRDQKKKEKKKKIYKKKNNDSIHLPICYATSATKQSFFPVKMKEPAAPRTSSDDA